MSGGGGTTQTKADPWVGVQPSLTALYSNLNTAYSNGQLSPNQNTGQVASWTPQMAGAFNGATSADANALGLTSALASGNIAGSGNIGAQTLSNFARGNFAGNAGTNALAGIAAGQYLDPNNPAMKQLYQAEAQPVTQNFTQAVMPSLLSTFAGNGRLGSGANMNAINLASSGLGQTLNNLSGQIYGQQVQNQLAAANQLGQLSNSSANMLSNLQGSALSALPGMGMQGMQTAGTYQDYLQNILNSNIAQQNYNANQPMIGLQNLSGLLQNGMSLNGSSSTTSQNKNTFGSALGGAATGAAMGSMVMPGIGTAVGGALGLLGGLL